MKKTFMTILAFATGACLWAQNANDALLFSENNYGGSARTIGMGNAVTAVGGDIGSIGFNPAGSAVSSYSQFSITPSVSISRTSSTGTATGSFEYKTDDDNTKFTVPGFGFILNFDTHRRSGLKSWSFGFTGQSTNNFLNGMMASGTNATTSYMGALANSANGIYFGDLDASNAYYNYPWDVIVGYRSGMISTYGGFEDQWMGTSEAIFPDPVTGEDVIGLPADSYLNQNYSNYKSGNKYDYIINFGGNFSDIFYIGANIGFTSLSYSSDESMYEAASDPKLFGITFDDGTVIHWDSMKHDYSIDVSGSGVYAKIGFIAKPMTGLRIGAAIQTPTMMSIKESWGMYGQTTYIDADTTSEPSPEDLGYQSYRLRSPYRANFGVAYTFGKIGLVSADYEFCDYSTMGFKAYRSNDNSLFIGVNSDIKDIMGLSHMLRLGAEIRPMPKFALRLGYNLTTSPQKDNLGNYDWSLKRQSISGGIGYSSDGSFFADVAVRGHILPDTVYQPYPHYLEADSPIIRTANKFVEAVATIGWRF